MYQQTQQTTKKTAPRRTVRRMSPADWETRALALAYDRHLVFRTRYEGVNELGHLAFTAPSISTPHLVHVVTIDPVASTVTCHCIAGSHLAPCAHAGAAIHHYRILQETSAREASYDPYEYFRKNLGE